MSAIKMEEVGVSDLNDFDNDETEENATDPLQELLYAKSKSARNFWNVDENEFLHDNEEPEAKKTKIENKKFDNWSSIPAKDAFEKIIETPKYEPKSKGPARTVTNPVEAWYLLLDDAILNIILRKTNEEIRKVRGKSSYERVLDLVELRAWIGLNYLGGLFRNSAHVGPLDELWSLELGNAVFRAAMSIKRYEFIASNLRMCKSFSKSRSVSNEVWKKFIINCRSYYSPSAYVVIDSVIDVADNTLLLCDAKTLYLYNAHVDEQGTNNNLENIQSLLADIKGSQRIVITGAQHTSTELAQLLQQNNLSLVGEIAHESHGIPRQESLKSENWSQPLYNGNLTLNAGNLLSSNLARNINAVKLYKTTHSACLNFLKIVDNYNTQNATPENLTLDKNKDLQDFHLLLNYAAFNAWTLLRMSVIEDIAMDQRDFLRQLGLYLTQQQLKKRLQHNERLSLTQKVVISEMLGESPIKYCTIANNKDKNKIEFLPVPEGTTMVTRFAEKRTRCRKCKGNNSPKTRTRCQQCLRNLCYRHIIFRCDDCTGVPAMVENNCKDNE